MTVGVCSVCRKAFETTEEDAGDPDCMCTVCFAKEREKAVIARFEVVLLKFSNGVCCISMTKHDKTLDSVDDFAGGHSYSDMKDVIMPAFYAAQADVDRRISNAGLEEKVRTNSVI